MRHPLSSRGKTPSTCHACREANPETAWCDFHRAVHPIAEFPVNDRPIGIENICRQANSHRVSIRRGHAPIECVSCGSVGDSWNHRGGRAKSPTCRDCEALHEGQRWCLDCASWLDHSNFNRTGVDGNFWTVRCKPCRVANNHGVTVAQLLERQGTEKPECAACGSTEFLKVDHDHRCCPAQCGCSKCVRGYLCHECNTSEGLLRTSDRALKLATYMQKYGY